MNPGTGGFVSMDSYGGSTKSPLSLNKYLYANDSPLNWSDPTGMFSLTEVSTVVNIIGIGSTSIHAGFKIAEGDYKGAAYEVGRDSVFWALGAGVGKYIAPLSKAAFGIFARTFIKPIILNAERNGEVLTKNMEAVMGMEKPFGWQAHHIVGAAYAEGKAAMKILEKFRIDVNSPLNGVFLPGCGATGSTGLIGLAVHCGKHIRQYEIYVYESLKLVKSESEAVNVLSRIRSELLDGELFLNMRGNL